ncbi:MAG: HD domain-containing protein [Actinomycetota bacterium]|nr:HD domain-containing protein [Actinomycetota bacterium]
MSTTHEAIVTHDGGTCDAALDAWLERPGMSVDGVRVPHADVAVRVEPVLSDRAARERGERRLSPSACRGLGAGRRMAGEAPDPLRSCFERDRDRILHSKPFRRLAGKTQVVASPPDHVRTRLTHSLEVAQIARSIAVALGLSEPLAEAIALGHDVGHTPLGHAGEAVLDSIVPSGYDHAVAGAEVLAALNLCLETLDGVRNHSWSRPSPLSAEGAVVSLADRIAYVCHDWSDACEMGLVSARQLPAVVVRRLGATQGAQIAALISDVVAVAREVQVVGLSEPLAEALDAFRAANFELIYSSELARRQREAARPLIVGLVLRYARDPQLVPGATGLVEPGSDEALGAAVRYVAGMTDRFCVARGEELCGFDKARIPVVA